MKDFTDPLDILENRINLLENRVIGKSNKLDVKTPVMDSLLVINSQIANALAGREQVTAVLKRLNELEKFMDPSYGDDIPLSAKAKLDVILSMEPEIEQNMKYFQQLQQLKSILDSEHIKNIPALQSKLDKLIVIELENKEKFENVTKEIYDMIEQYNDIVNSLSQSFVVWESTVTNCEIARQVKKPVD
ncbi:dynactin subunit 3 [Hetaerina americana]|uniref:dynactin subunit 3 n=1 Tax=Hetaerina americana TaxID=62018 RepID=UPI003A7F2084